MIRYTTNLTKTEINDKRRPGRNFRIAEQVKTHLSTILPQEICEVAIATCRFSIMGRDAHNDNGQALRNMHREASPPWICEGRWIHTRLQTYGYLPSTRFQRTGTTEKSVWVVGDSFAAADSILECFGLTMRDVLEHYGNVDTTERKVIDLVDIVEDMASNLLRTAA